MALITLLVVLVLLWYLLHPGKCTQAQRAILYGKNCARRGLYTKNQEIPENSLAAFGNAVKHGYGIELDITLSSDGDIVVFRDDDLFRMCGINGCIEDFTTEQLQNMRLKGTEETIPLFTEVLPIVKGKTPLIVTLNKCRTNDILCQKTLDVLTSYNGNFCIESFEPTIVAWFYKNAPDILRGQLATFQSGYATHSPVKKFVLTNTLLNFKSRPQFIGYIAGRRSLGVYIAQMLGAIKVVWAVSDNHAHKSVEEHNDCVIFEHYLPQRKYK